MPNARLLDPNVLSPTFTQQQQLRNFYGFPDQLAMDRYTVDGKTQDYVVAVRELNADGLNDAQKNWINEHMVFTHGDGFVAAPANTVVERLPGLHGVGHLQHRQSEQRDPGRRSRGPTTAS